LLSIQRDPVAALPALYLPTHYVESYLLSMQRDPVAALPALYLPTH
jgi:hypothetical protein